MPRPLRPRRGVALLLALILLGLCAALVVGATNAANSLARSALSSEAGTRTTGAAQSAIALTVASWTPALDSLVIGTGVDQTQSGNGMTVRIHVERISDRRYLMVASAAAGRDSVSLASRNITILLERPLKVDSLAQTNRPIPVARWPLADIY